MCQSPPTQLKKMHSVTVLKGFCTTIQGRTAFILITGSECVFFVLFFCFISGSSTCQFRPSTYTLCLIIFASTNWLVYNPIVSALALDFFLFFFVYFFFFLFLLDWWGVIIAHKNHGQNENQTQIVINHIFFHNTTIMLIVIEKQGRLALAAGAPSLPVCTATGWSGAKCRLFTAGLKLDFRHYMSSQGWDVILKLIKMRDCHAQITTKTS